MRSLVEVFIAGPAAAEATQRDFINTANLVTQGALVTGLITGPLTVAASVAAMGFTSGQYVEDNASVAGDADCLAPHPSDSSPVLAWKGTMLNVAMNPLRCVSL